MFGIVAKAAVSLAEDVRNGRESVEASEILGSSYAVS